MSAYIGGTHFACSKRRLVFNDSAMTSVNLAGPTANTTLTPDPSFAALERAIEHAAHVLPAQGPISAFIHHNTLHAFEHLPFDEAVVEGGRLFGCEPYLQETAYRDKLAQGRIRSVDLDAVLQSEADGPIASLTTRVELRRTMLVHEVVTAPAAELRWFMTETDALRRLRSDLLPEHRKRWLEASRVELIELQAARGTDSRAKLVADVPKVSEDWPAAKCEEPALQTLWRVCRQGVHTTTYPHRLPPSLQRHSSIRHRDWLLEACGEDADLLVHDVLIRFCAAFIDQGLSHWMLPHRDQGFRQAFTLLYKAPGGPPDAWLRGLRAELIRIDQAKMSSLDSILESLQLLGVAEEQWETYLTHSLLALRGWSGMIRQLELRGDRVALPVPTGSLVDLLAVRLLLDRLALAYLAAQHLSFAGPLHGVIDAARAHIHAKPTGEVDQRAFLVFQLAQLLGWTPLQLHKLSKLQWSQLLEEIESFSGIERRRTFHAAFERRYRIQSLDAIATHAAKHPELPQEAKFQLVCCLDEREESFRRHIEEIEPASVTFGAAGFYSVPMYYRGAAETHFVPLCPIIIQPKHWVLEDVAYTDEELHGQRAKARRVLGKTSHQLHVGTRTITGGALITAGLGALAAIPLVARVLFPRLTAQIRRLAGRIVQPPSNTRLRLERSTPQAGPVNGQIGFSLEEMIASGERLLRDIGLLSGFARIVIFLGHGSFSLNNPHNSAYNCGACGGNAGGPNARAFAHLMNDPRVRSGLRGRGIDIPDDVRFVGGYHNTCNDEVSYFDLDALPATHKSDFDHLREVIDQASARNAHERCRRFMSAPLTLSFEAAKRHVESRSEDLAQTRPELGHATNALCFVGRRSRTRGLFMDRRTFLTSYDPAQDDAETSILMRLLQAAVPVCSGINLEYYFSHIDSTGYGCGTKLPHNVTSLLGIMDGAASDLRSGLPWQMVEMHEPVRLLFVIETTPEKMLDIMRRNAEIGRLCMNGWVQMATLSPESNQLHLLWRGDFVPYEPEHLQLPCEASSLAWYRGQREHLGYAQIVSPTKEAG
jgi:uncharacterized protein